MFKFNYMLKGYDAIMTLFHDANSVISSVLCTKYEICYKGKASAIIDISFRGNIFVCYPSTIKILLYSATDSPAIFLFTIIIYLKQWDKRIMFLLQKAHIYSIRWVLNPCALHVAGCFFSEVKHVQRLLWKGREMGRTLYKDYMISVAQDILYKYSIPKRKLIPFAWMDIFGIFG